MQLAAMIIGAACLCIMVYDMCSACGRFARFLGILTLESFTASALGLAVGSVAPSPDAAQVRHMLQCTNPVWISKSPAGQKFLKENYACEPQHFQVLAEALGLICSNLLGSQLPNDAIWPAHLSRRSHMVPMPICMLDLGSENDLVWNLSS